jgi:epoxyqueuosine reductase
MKDELRSDLLTHGAAVVGFADLQGFLGDDIAHLGRAVSIGVDRRLNENTLTILMKLQKRAFRCLKSKDYRALAIPPDSDRKQGTFISKLYCLINHKMAATSAGLGWIGKNGLLINPDHGPRLSLATVLTDAPFEPDTPIGECRCEACVLCVEHCPSKAITGAEWSRSSPFVELVRLKDCRNHTTNKRKTEGKPNCGLCINICPYSRRQPALHTADNDRVSSLRQGH